MKKTFALIGIVILFLFSISSQAIFHKAQAATDPTVIVLHVDNENGEVINPDTPLKRSVTRIYGEVRNVPMRENPYGARFFRTFSDSDYRSSIDPNFDVYPNENPCTTIPNRSNGFEEIACERISEGGTTTLKVTFIINMDNIAYNAKLPTDTHLNTIYTLDFGRGSTLLAKTTIIFGPDKDLPPDQSKFEIIEEKMVPNPATPGRDYLTIPLKDAYDRQQYTFSIDYNSALEPILLKKGISGPSAVFSELSKYSGNNTLTNQYVCIIPDIASTPEVETIGNCTLKSPLYLSPALILVTEAVRDETTGTILYNAEAKVTVIVCAGPEINPSIYICDTAQVSIMPAVTPTPFPPPCYDAKGNILISGATGKCQGLQTAFGIIHTEPGPFISRVLALLLGISGAIALVLIIRASYILITSRGDPEKVENAKEILTAAIVGLLFIIFSLVIIEVIGVDILQIPGFER